MEKVDHLFEIVHLKRFRETKGVIFDVLTKDLLEPVSGIDRVIHLSNAVSPGKIGDVNRPWYMHKHQSDNLLVLHGERHIDLYTKEHGKVEKFIVTPTSIYRNSVLICDIPGMLIWPPNVFHRVESKEKGSASINFAYREDGFDVKDNFDIYDLDTQTGEYKVIRQGFKDQI
jgi:hypothetical protein